MCYLRGKANEEMFQVRKTRGENEAVAKQYGKKLVDAIAAGNYEMIPEIVDEIDEGWTIEEIKKMLQIYQEENDVSEIFPYDTPVEEIVYADGSKYEKESFAYNDEDETNLDFSYDIDLNPTDLTLMLEFVHQAGKYRVILIDIHQL